MAHELNPVLRFLRGFGPLISDSALVAAIRAAGEEAAVEEVIRRHGPMVLRVCRRVLRHQQDAEDAFQATFVVFLRRAGSIDKPDSLASWLHGVALRVSQELLAVRRRQRAEFLSKDLARGSACCPVEQADLAAVVHAEVAGLPPHYRAPVVLCELQGRSRKDAAREVGVPEGTLSSRLATAKRLLAERLGDRGLVAVAVGGILADEAAAAPIPAGLAARTARLLVGTAAGDSAAGVVSAEVNRVAYQVVSAMTKSKLRGSAAGTALLVISFGILAAAVGGGSRVPGPVVSTAAAAPIPSDMSEGRIWVRYRKTDKLVALTPTGRSVRESTLNDGPLILRVSPTRNKVWFAGRDGRPQESDPGDRWPAGRLTLHVREFEGGAGGKNLGIEITAESILSHDGKIVGLVEMQQNGTVNRPFIFQNSLIEVSTKRVTKLDLPPTHKIMDIAPDGKWVLTFEHTDPRAEKGTPPYRLHQFPVAGGKPRLLSGSLSTFFGHRMSPDGTRVLTFSDDGEQKIGSELPSSVSVYLIDVATAKATRVGGHDKQLWSYGVWSPDSKRIAYAWRARNDGIPIKADGVPPTRLVVCDADGRNAATILTSDEDFTPLGWW